MKQQLREELEEYLRIFILGGLKVKDDDEGHQVIAEINKVLQDAEVSRQIGQAVFQKFDLGRIIQIAEEQRRKVREIHKAYFDRHICLYVAGPSWDPDNPQPPPVYNDLVDMFYDEAAGGWINKEKPSGEAILIFITENKTTEQKEDNDEHTGERKEV